jgi:hypothetical protein
MHQRQPVQQLEHDVAASGQWDAGRGGGSLRALYAPFPAVEPSRWTCSRRAAISPASCTKEHWVRGTATRSPRPQLLPMPAAPLVLYSATCRRSGSIYWMQKRMSLRKYRPLPTAGEGGLGCAPGAD